VDFKGKTNVTFVVTETDSTISIDIPTVGTLEMDRASAKAFLRSLSDIVDVVQSDYEPNFKPAMNFDKTAGNGKIELRT